MRNAPHHQRLKVLLGIPQVEGKHLDNISRTNHGAQARRASVKASGWRIEGDL